MPQEDFQQLIHDERFINYCFQRNEADIAYWTRWMQEHPGQQAEIERMRRIVLMMGSASRERLQAEDFGRLQQRIHLKDGKSIRRHYVLWRTVAAAVILLFLGIGVFLYFQFDRPSSMQTVVDIQPGGNRAMLQLVDGKSIALSGDKEGLIVQDGEFLYSDGTALAVAPASEYRITTPVGGQYQVTLADGTHVWLNAASSITYPETFSQEERRVMITGEAYLEVAHEASRPFRVETGGQLVEVLGTHFNIHAYPEEKVITTTLVEGSIRVGLPNQKVPFKTLYPGQQSQVQNGVVQISDVDIEKVLGWKNGLFIFNDEPLENIMQALSRWYDVEVVYEGQVDRKRRFGAEFSRNESLLTLLKKLEKTEGFHFKIEGRRIILTE